MLSSLLKATIAVAVTPVTLAADVLGSAKDCVVGDDPRGLQSTREVTKIAADNFKEAIEPEHKK